MSRSSKQNGQPGELHCYDCGVEYDYLGGGSHPGVCPSCGGRAVSLAGDVEVRGVFEREIGSGDVTSIDVVVADETPRPITYAGSARDDYVYVEVAVLGSARLKAGTEAWRADVVPPAVVEVLKSRGYSYVPCSERWDDREGFRDAR